MNLSDLKRCVLKADGTVIDLPEPIDFAKVEEYVGAPLGHSTLVSMRKPGDRYWIMWVDDVGLYKPELKVNELATILYRETLRFPTFHCVIVGDVVVHDYVDDPEE
jgi:hypothetical protein